MPNTPSSSGGGGGAANASSDERQRASPSSATDAIDEDYPLFGDIELLFPIGLGDDDDDDCWYMDDQVPTGQHQETAPAPAPATATEAVQGDEERLVMYYRGQRFVYDSVQPQKIENILLLLNGQEMAQSVRPHPTHLVKPIAVPENFDRFAAVTRYREKRRNIKFVKKADYSARRKVALRMKRSKGKFAPTVNTSEESLPAGTLEN